MDAHESRSFDDNLIIRAGYDSTSVIPHLDTDFSANAFGPGYDLDSLASKDSERPDIGRIRVSVYAVVRIAVDAIKLDTIAEVMRCGRVVRSVG